MDSAPILAVLEAVTRRWTKQRKAEERDRRASFRRAYLWVRPTTLKEHVHGILPQAWDEASGGGRLPTHWRMVFYRARPLVAALSDTPLTDDYFKQVLDEYLERLAPGWDVLRGARGVLKEPHGGKVVALSTLGVRHYLAAGPVAFGVGHLGLRFPTRRADNRYGAVLICEKEGFDELLVADGLPARYDLALMSTKGIPARAARDLARNLGVPCFTLHDLDKNGFVMAAGFRGFATDIGLRLADVEARGLAAETQHHANHAATARNLKRNGATPQEAEFIAAGQRVELNELTGPSFIEFVASKLEAHGVGKVIPDRATLTAAWRRAKLVHQINALIDAAQGEAAMDTIPRRLATRVAEGLAHAPPKAWDDVIAELAASRGDG